MRTSVSQPPTSGPRAATPPMVPPQTAKAIARSLPTKTALMTESELGRIIAPPMPWRARAAMRVLAESDAATSTLAADEDDHAEHEHGTCGRIGRRPARTG